MENTGEVNPHYLEHVMNTSQKREMEASEDIMSRSGLKLLAKGARIDGSVKERLLQHKLLKPLEECMKVVGAVDGVDLMGTATALLDQHPMLRELFNRPGSKALIGQLKTAMVSVPFESMMTVYAEHGENKIGHAVGASLLCMGLLDRIGIHADESRIRQAMLAGLCHDVGELYIDPAFLTKGVKLEPHQWKHIAAHPIVGHRVLKEMPRVSESVAQMVLAHHERLDGFGYPHGLQADKISLPAQVLAVSELLIGLLESRPSPARAAEVALKLIPGEFGRPVIDAVSTLCRACSADPVSASELPAIDELIKTASKVALSVRHVEGARTRICEAIDAGSAPFRELMRNAVARHERIRRAFSSTGLDADNFEFTLREIESARDTETLFEMKLVAKEIIWRYRELERELRVRVDRLMPHERPRLEQVLGLASMSAAPKVEPVAAPA